ncbi:MAG: BMP family ABC transporter substrate-binding protein [Bdellovibrionota bacterium]
MRNLILLLVCAFFSMQGLAIAANPIKVALILDKGGKDDKSFNSAASRGANEAKAKLGIDLKEIEANEDSLFEPAMRRFISKKYDLIVGIGVAQAEAIKKLSREFPDQKFAIVDAPVEAHNVVSAMFEEHIGSYLVGYIAGLKTTTGNVGFIGGVDGDLIRRFEKGYIQGVKAARPKAKVQVNYVGVSTDAWNNPTRAKELAMSQYRLGADIIFVAAGASNNGCFDAAEEEKKFAIGVDSNQNWIKPGRILTSMLKRVDTAVYEMISDAAKGQFKAGVKIFTIKNQGIDWALDEHNRALFTESDVNKISDLKAKLVAGKVAVVDYYKEKKAKK